MECLVVFITEKSWKISTAISSGMQQNPAILNYFKILMRNLAEPPRYSYIYAEAKKAILDYTNKDVWNNATSDKDMDKDHFKKIAIEKTEVGTYIDLDLVPVEYEQSLIKSAYRAFYFEKGKTAATVYWFQSAALTNSSYELVARIREPLIHEPLDFTLSSDFGHTIWNLNNFEVKINLSKILMR